MKTEVWDKLNKKKIRIMGVTETHKDNPQGELTVMNIIAEKFLRSKEFIQSHFKCPRVSVKRYPKENHPKAYIRHNDECNRKS